MLNPVQLITSVAILTLMVLPGYLLGKFRLANGEFAKGLSNFVLYAAQSCLFLRAFISTPITGQILARMGIMFVLSFLVHLLFTGISFFFYRKAPEHMRTILRFATIFTNAGYMSLALFELLFPGNSEITVYTSVYLVFFNMYVWSVGAMIHTKDKSYVSVRHMFLNPAIISTAIGFILFVCRAYLWFDQNPVTSVLHQAFDILADTVCPLSMVVVGIRLGLMSFRGFFRDKYLYLYLFVRLLLSPVLAWCVIRLALLPFSGFLSGDDIAILTTVCLVCASTPAATICSMFAEKYGTDAAYSGKLVSVSTLASVITMPVCALLLLI